MSRPFDITTARLPREALDNALNTLERDGDDSALRELVSRAAHEDQRERLETLWLTPMRLRNTGSVKQPRDKNGLTPKQAATAKGYAKFHDGLARGLARDIADAEAVFGNPIFATVTKERRALIYRNGDTVINGITRAAGTFRKNAASLFLGHEKVEAANLIP